MPRIVRTDSFLEQFSELRREAQKHVLKTLRLLGDNPKHPSLRVHRIKGTPLWEAYASKSIRVIFQREGDTLILLACGHHDILKKY
ncbi:MAG: type II toxin-antitoxin system RelE/ParE family toxin [Desulfotomaculales bacterium]